MYKNQPKGFFIIMAFALAMLSCSLFGCSDRDDWDTQFLSKLHQPTRQVLQDLSFKVYPYSDLINDSFEIQPIKSFSTDNMHKPSYAITTNIWLSTNDDLEKVRNFYSKALPNTISQQSQDGRITFIQLASVNDISSAVIQKVSPVIMIEIHHKKLSKEEKAMYQNELNGLKKRAAKDTLSQKRIYQLERVLAEKLLMRISIRKVTSEI
ncbi:MAG: hypothetical protein PHS88_05490 [Candidatus Omnitrophica bacterium]|nr:hypothetical protein [Candidatus Omnitrophota bacterium]